MHEYYKWQKKKKMLNINIYIHIEFMMIDENWNLYPSGELRIMYWGDVLENGLYYIGNISCFI